MNKYNRSKVVKELLSQNLTDEQIIEKALQLGETSKDNLMYCIKRTKKQLSKVNA